MCAASPGPLLRAMCRRVHHDQHLDVDDNMDNVLLLTNYSVVVGCVHNSASGDVPRGICNNSAVVNGDVNIHQSFQQKYRHEPPTTSSKSCNHLVSSGKPRTRASCSGADSIVNMHDNDDVNASNVIISHDNIQSSTNVTLYLHLILIASPDALKCAAKLATDISSTTGVITSCSGKSVSDQDRQQLLQHVAMKWKSMSAKKVKISHPCAACNHAVEQIPFLCSTITSFKHVVHCLFNPVYHMTADSMERMKKWKKADDCVRRRTC